MYRIKNIYFGFSATNEAKKIYKAFKKKKIDDLEMIYVVSLSETEGTILEIIDAVQAIALKIKPIGYAIGKAEAVDMVKEIIDEVYNKTGGFDVKSYLKGQE